MTHSISNAPFYIFVILWCIQVVFGQQEYFAINSATNMATAQLWCEQRGSTLATIHSAQDLANAQAVVKATDTNGNFWIGLTDAATEGRWVWTDGSPSDFGFYNNDPSRPTVGVSPWWPGEPNDYGSGEDCAQIWVPSRNYLWNDIRCTNSLKVLCNAGSSAPTKSSSPTESPTVDPTSFPTDIPTSFPTPLPTRTENITNTTEYIEIVTTTPPLITLPSESEPTIILDDDAAFGISDRKGNASVNTATILIVVGLAVFIGLGICCIYVLYRGMTKNNYQDEQQLIRAPEDQLEMGTAPVNSNDVPGMGRRMTNPVGVMPENTEDYVDEPAAPAVPQETRPGQLLAEGN